MKLLKLNSLFSLIILVSLLVSLFSIKNESETKSETNIFIGFIGVFVRFFTQSFRCFIFFPQIWVGNGKGADR